MGKRNFLPRRYGINSIPFLGINSILILIELYGFNKFGKSYQFPLSFSYLLVVIFLNIIPLLYLYGVWSYRVGFDDGSIFVRPLFKTGPYLEMRFDDIDAVDLKPVSDLGGSAIGNSSPSVIALYRKGWDGEEVFALDPGRTNLRRFKDLVGLIHQRRPETFTENALRYLNRSDLLTPYAAADGHLIW